MRSGRIIAGMLVLLGFGSCCNRASKSKAPEQTAAPEMVADTSDITPIRMMYGVPRREFRPIKIKQDTIRTKSAPDSRPEAAEAPKPAEKSE